jgi:hypothetical protein
LLDQQIMHQRRLANPGPKWTMKQISSCALAVDRIAVT